MKRMAIWFLSLICFGLLSQQVLAASDPVKMLNNTTDQLLAQLRANPSQTKNNPQYVYGLVRKIVLPQVDVTGMARSALGRTYWTQATPAQRQQFTKEFTILMVQTYGSALSAYSDETVKYYPMRGSASGKTRTQVNSAILRSDGPPIKMNYRLILKSDQWKVYDISIEGVSILRSFRTQFSSEISELGMDAFLKKFAQHNKKNQ